jgi:orotate phosphoribosyltransferase
MADLESRIIKFQSKKHLSDVPLKAVPGHFATNHSHINYYIDLTTLKSRQNEAASSAHSLALQYMHSTIVDTIVCFDGMEVIGAYLADELNRAGFLSCNAHKTIYVVKPEYISSSQLLFRDNIQPMIKNRHIILLMASVTTGISIQKGIECVQYYGGEVVGVSTIFSAINKYEDMPINTLFTPDDIPGYQTYSRHECPFCKNNQKVEALVNSFGYSML